MLTLRKYDPKSSENSLNLLGSEAKLQESNSEEKGKS